MTIIATVFYCNHSRERERESKSVATATATTKTIVKCQRESAVNVAACFYAKQGSHILCELATDALLASESNADGGR